MACLRVTVRQPSGASFEVQLPNGATLQRLKAQIATRSPGPLGPWEFTPGGANH